MTIYLASAFDQRWWLRAIEPVLLTRGWTVVSDWYHLTDGDVQAMDAAGEARWARRNFLALREAEVLLLFLQGSSAGGRWTEFGIALAEGKPCVLVGETTNVFRYLPGVSVVEEGEWLGVIDELAMTLNRTCTITKAGGGTAA